MWLSNGGNKLRNKMTTCWHTKGTERPTTHRGRTIRSTLWKQFRPEHGWGHSHQTQHDDQDQVYKRRGRGEDSGHLGLSWEPHRSTAALCGDKGVLQVSGNRTTGQKLWFLQCQIWPVMLLMCLYLQKMKDIYHTFFILECHLTLVPCSVITLNFLLFLRCSDKTVDLCPGVWIGL